MILSSLLQDLSPDHLRWEMINCIRGSLPSRVFLEYQVRSKKSLNSVKLSWPTRFCGEFYVLPRAELSAKSCAEVPQTSRPHKLSGCSKVTLPTVCIGFGIELEVTFVKTVFSPLKETCGVMKSGYQI